MKTSPPTYAAALALLAGGMLLLASPARSQMFSGRLGLGYGAHFENAHVGQPLAKPTVPSLGVFFENNLLVGADVMFIPSKAPDAPLVRLMFEHQSIGSTYPSPGNILGNSVGISSLALCAGFKRGLGENAGAGSYQYVNVGYVLKFYQGETQADATTLLRSMYEKGRAVRLGAGVRVGGIFPEGVKLAFDASYDFGTVRRAKIEVYRAEEYVSSLDPTGDMVLPDNVLTIQLGVCYDLHY